MRHGVDLEKCEVEAFCIVFDQDGKEQHVAAPIAKDTAEALIDILIRTYESLATEKGEDDWSDFELSENARGSTAVKADTRDDMFQRIRAIYDARARPVSIDAFREHSGQIRYYYAIFRDSQGKRVIAFKRAKVFKASLKAKYLVLRDSLEVVPDQVFRLDNLFDFIVEKTQIIALNATALEEIAELESYIRNKYGVRAMALAKAVPDIDWHKVRTYADSRPRAQRLIIALSRREDIRSLDTSVFRKLLKDCGAEFSVVNGQFVPDEKSELKFLEALEGRRWLHNISGKHPIRYRAINRQQD